MRIGEMEVQLHVFLGARWSSLLDIQGRFTAGPYWIGGRVGSGSRSGRGGEDEKSSFSAPVGKRTPNVQPVA
jgi:hypothetical protein